MSPTVQRALGTFAFCIAGFAIVGFFLPNHYVVERSVHIKANPASVFGYINDVKKSEAWSPWKVQDPSYVYTYDATTKGLGAGFAWKGDSGAGHLRIIKSVPHTLVVAQVVSADMGESLTTWRFSTVDQEVDVAWTFTGDAPGIMGGYMAAFMDPILGPHLEFGLERLKAIAESPDAAHAAEADPVPH